jgi:NAD(P)-dependent dehydrogenase (short-subunit alcohol dehydrogenase family)
MSDQSDVAVVIDAGAAKSGPGEVAVVTGAGSGIGRAATDSLLRAGWRVALAGRREDALRETLAQAPEPHTALVVPTDVTDDDQVRSLFERVLGEWGRVDLLFNNAGLFGAAASFADTDPAEWRRVIDTNLNGSFLCAREAFRAMRDQDPRGGRIINNGSISAHVPRPHAAAYTAGKHAVTGLTKAISLEGRPYSIACGQIDVGNAATELTAAMGQSHGALQADGSRLVEPTMDVRHVGDAVLQMASLPLDANVEFMTIMATNMPYIGRG